jgi:hypothetical protein
MSVRPHPTREGAWYIDLGYGKNRERIPFAGSKEDALLYEAERKKVKRPVNASCFELVNTLIDRYLDSYKLEHQDAGYKTQIIRCQHLKPFFGRMLLQNISAQEVEKYILASYWKTKSHLLQSKELCALSGLFKWLKKCKLLNRALPSKKVPW